MTIPGHDNVRGAFDLGSLGFIVQIPRLRYLRLPRDKRKKKKGRKIPEGGRRTNRETPAALSKRNSVHTHCVSLYIHTSSDGACAIMRTFCYKYSIRWSNLLAYTRYTTSTRSTNFHRIYSSNGNETACRAKVDM